MLTACSQCSPLSIPDHNGEIILFTGVSQFIISLEQLLEESNIRFVKGQQTFQLSYSDFTFVKALFSQLSEVFNEHAMSQIYCEIKSIGAASIPSAFIPVSHWIKRTERMDFLHIISNASFTNHMQPIVSFQDNRIYGYEFMLRPSKKEFPFFPAELFRFAQETGLQSLLDSQARMTAIQVGAEKVDKGIKRFINFLPSSIYDPNHCLNTTFKAVEKYGVDPEELVFEVVETEKIEDFQHLKNIFKTYQRNGMKVALDDVGAGYSTIEVIERLNPDYVKIDRDLVSYIDISEEKKEAVQSIIDICRKLDIKVLAEGIERSEEADYFKDKGIGLGQGYYFGKPDAEPYKKGRL